MREQLAPCYPARVSQAQRASDSLAQLVKQGSRIQEAIPRGLAMLEQLTSSMNQAVSLLADVKECLSEAQVITQYPEGSEQGMSPQEEEEDVFGGDANLQYE